VKPLLLVGVFLLLVGVLLGDLKSQEGQEIFLISALFVGLYGALFLRGRVS